MKQPQSVVKRKVPLYLSMWNIYLLTCCKGLSHLPGQLHQVLVFFKAQNLQVQHYYLERQQTIWLPYAPNFEMHTLDFVLLMFICHRHKSNAAKQITIQKAYDRKSRTRILHSIVI